MANLQLDNLTCKRVFLSESENPYLVLPPNSEDPIVKNYLRGECSNDYMLQILRATTLPGDLVIDVGCHVGTFSIGAAAMGRRVLAIDANPLHVELVLASSRMNGFSDVFVVNNAVSMSSDPIRFIPNGLFGAIDFSGDRGDTISIDTITLDEFVSRYSNARKVRFLKMDIEGAEFDALLSAERLLIEDKPIIWWESNNPTLKLAGRSVRDVRMLLESKGYKTFRVEGERWIYADPDQIQPEAWVDMLSISTDHQEKWIDRISWKWAETEILERCRFWANLPYKHVLENLIEEIDRSGLGLDFITISDQCRKNINNL